MDYIATQFLQMQDEILYFTLTSLVNEINSLLKDSHDNPVKDYTLKEVCFVPSKRLDKFNIRVSFSKLGVNYLHSPINPSNYLSLENAKKVSKLFDLLDIEKSEDLSTMLNVFFNKQSNIESFSLTYPDEENKNLKKFLGDKFFPRYEKEYLEKQVNDNIDNTNNITLQSKNKKLKV